MAAPWDETAGDALGAIRWELECLWDDLATDRRCAINTEWSIACERTASRIGRLSQHVGAVPWERVSVDLLLDGTYARVYENSGVAYPPVDWERVHRVAERIDSRRRERQR